MPAMSIAHAFMLTAYVEACFWTRKRCPQPSIIQVRDATQRVRSTITAHVKESLRLAAYIAQDVRRPVHCPAPYSHRPLAEGLGRRSRVLANAELTRRAGEGAVDNDNLLLK